MSRNPPARIPLTSLLHSSVVVHFVSVEYRVCWSLTALYTALAPLHDHHVFFDGVTVGTLELEPFGLGLLGGAAFTFGALSALFERDCVGFAALVCQSLVHLHCSRTAFSFLWKQNEKLSLLFYSRSSHCYLNWWCNGIFKVLCNTDRRVIELIYVSKIISFQIQRTKNKVNVFKDCYDQSYFCIHTCQ